MTRAAFLIADCARPEASECLESNWNGPIPAVSEQSGVRIAKQWFEQSGRRVLMERDAADSAERGFVPVSTEPEYSNLVSSSMRNRMPCRYVRIDLLSAVRIPRTSGGTPRRGFGTVIRRIHGLIGSVRTVLLPIAAAGAESDPDQHADGVRGVERVDRMIIFLVMRSVITPVRRSPWLRKSWHRNFRRRVAVDRPMR